MLICIGVAPMTVTMSTWNATPAMAVPKARRVVALQKSANAGVRSTSTGRTAPAAPAAALLTPPA